MATPLGVAPNYYTLFATRQGGSAPYTQYAVHMDVNFVAIRNTVNQLVSEMIGLGGPNAVIGLDMLKRDDPAGPLAAGTDGIVGRNGYLVTINGVDANRLNVVKGVAIAGGRRVELLVGLTSVFPGAGNITGGSGFVFVDVNGQPGFSDFSGQGALDLAECFHNGSVYTSVVMLPAILFDGDEFQYQLARAAKGTTFSAKTFKSLAARVDAIERMLNGQATDSEGGALGSPALNITLDSLSGVVVPTPTTGHALIFNGTDWVNAVVAGSPSTGLITAGTAQSTTSGTTKDFTALPASIRRIHVIFNEVSCSGTDVQVQLGDSGGFATSGYLSTSVTLQGAGNSTQARSDCFTVLTLAGADVLSGVMTILRVSGNIWIMSFAGKAATGTAVISGGSKTLSAELDRIRVTIPSGAFDAGSVNITYELA